MSEDDESQVDLSPCQKAAIKMLASGCTVRYTALVLRIDPTAISDWILHDTNFKSHLDEATNTSRPSDRWNRNYVCHCTYI